MKAVHNELYASFKKSENWRADCTAIVFPAVLVPCLADDLPRMGAAEEGRASSPAMANLELDQVDSQGRRWRRFCISGQEYHVNMSVLEPYLQVLSHGGESS